jgi:Protein of unknown function (DUF2442)
VSRPPRVVDVEHLGGRLRRVTFSDGLVRELDFAGTLDGLLASIDSDEAFGRASVDPTARTVCWPDGIDLDPDVLHGDYEPASGLPARLAREYRLQQTP